MTTNRYGHPHQEVLERLQEQGCFSYSTMDYGAVCIQSDGIKTDIFGYCDKDSYLFPKNTKKMTILLK